MELQALDVISINLWDVIYAIANLALIFFIFKKLLFKPVRKILDKRQGEVEEIYSTAEQIKLEAETSRAEYEERIAGAKQEASDIIRAAHERADRLEDEIVSEAHTEAEELMRRADAEIAQERKKAVNELKDEISAISVEIAEKMLEREIDEKTHEDLISRFIEEIGEDDE